MHAFAVLSLFASAALVAAQQETYVAFQPLTTFGSPLEARQEQSCASLGGKPCGARCIRISYTCCGNGQGACEVGYTCGIAANGIYGCCPIGKRCSGDAPEPSTTIIGGSRPTTSVDSGDDDEPTPVPTTRATPTTTRRLTPATTNTPVRTTQISGDDETTPSAVPTSASGSGSGSGSGSSSSNGNSGGSSTANSGGSTGGSASSAVTVGVSLAGLAGGFIAAIAALL